MSIAHRILVPIALLALLFLYLAWEVDAGYARWLIPCLIAGAIVYAMTPQINWWWWQRNPPDLEPQFRDLPARFSPFYNTLPAEAQRRFRSRVFLLREATDWTAMAWPEEKVPIDVQIALAAQSATLSFGRDKFLMEKFEKVIVYPKPFLSPEFPFPHAAELFEPDGCLIFSAEQVINGVVQPRQWYNVALHEYARAFVRNWPAEPYPAFADDAATWQKLESLSGMPLSFIETVRGLTDTEPLAVAIHHFFVFPQKFEAAYPEASAVFRRIFFGHQ